MANIRSDKFALEQQFHEGSMDTTYKMTKRPSARGMVQTHTGRRKNLMKRKRNKTRHLVVLFFIAFIMLSPQVRENLFQKWAPGANEYVLLSFSEFHMYPNEATFTLERAVEVSSSGVNGAYYEEIPIPSDETSLIDSSTDFHFTNGSIPSSTSTIQKVNRILLNVGDSGNAVLDSVTIPLNGLPTKDYDDRVITSRGHSVWWPGYGTEDTSCKVAQCVKVELALGAGEVAILSYQVTVTSTSYSWWDAARVDSRIDGIDEGINVDNSGTFDDIENRGNGERHRNFTDERWYNRGIVDGEDLGYAIDGQHEIVNQTANSILSNLPENSKDNAYAYAREAFDYLLTFVTYDKQAPRISRSGPACLEAQTGDCDDQTNAFLSLLRVKGVPGWYVFGVLATNEFSSWEAHAWSYIQLPMSDDWCESRNIALHSCFVEASVDVVNNKWLLHTPNAYISWIEEYDSTGQKVHNIYYTWGANSKIDRSPPAYTTIGMPEQTGGFYEVKVLPENNDYFFQGWGKLAYNQVKQW